MDHYYQKILPAVESAQPISPSDYAAAKQAISSMYASILFFSYTSDLSLEQLLIQTL